MATKWDKKRSEWYCKAIEKSNYPHKAINALSHVIKQCGDIIDFGAGCGALSIPLALKVKKVTAVEPSQWMLNLLRARTAKAGVKNIRTFKAGWKVSGSKRDLLSEVKPHDAVICANLPPNVVCNVKFFHYISKLAKKYVIYLNGAGKWNRFYYDDLYPMLLNKKYGQGGDYLNTYAFLHKQGIYANVDVFEFKLDQPFNNFEEAMDFWRHRLKIKLSSRKEKLLADFLKKKLISSERGSSLTAAFGTRRAAVMWWKQ